MGYSAVVEIQDEKAAIGVGPVVDLDIAQLEAAG